MLAENSDTHNNKKCLLVPIIDVSSSMVGEKMGKCNYIVSNILQSIRKTEICVETSVVTIKFCDEARCTMGNDHPVDLKSFHWTDLDADGISDFGAAFGLLNEKLKFQDQGGWINSNDNVCPVLILVSDGGPSCSYRDAFDELKSNKIFAAACRVAILIECVESIVVLQEFTGDSAAVLNANDPSKVVGEVVDIILKTLTA